MDRKDSDGDEISYKVYFGETSNPGYVSTTHSNQLTITNKDWGKKYYWKYKQATITEEQLPVKSTLSRQRRTSSDYTIQSKSI